MKIISRITDKKIDALNVIVEMTIKEYMQIAKEIINKNEFQRRRVKKANTVYALLKEDLKKGCVIPPIVLGVKTDILENVINIYDFPNDDILELFNNHNNFIILDGLQRTYTIIDLIDEVKKEDNNLINEVYSNPLRIEIYLGLKRIGILYRMLTLNTGQTPMSSRHQIEILYTDYNQLNNINLFTEKDKTKNKKIGDYQFQDVIAGFNSYLNRNEMGISKGDLLDNIANLEKLAKKDDTDLFKEYIETYTKFLIKINELADNWKFEKDTNNHYFNVFGTTILSIFTKQQALSGFGAAIGYFEDKNVIKNFQEIANHIKNIKTDTISTQDALNDLINKLNDVRSNARNIGAEQRLFFSRFFRELFNKKEDAFLNIDKAVEEGYESYKLKV